MGAVDRAPSGLRGQAHRKGLSTNKGAAAAVAVAAEGLVDSSSAVGNIYTQHRRVYMLCPPKCVLSLLTKRFR